MIKSLHEFNFRGWDILFANPTFDFYFKFQIPKPMKERLIVERNKLGHIVTSEILNMMGYN